MYSCEYVRKNQGTIKNILIKPFVINFIPSLEHNNHGLSNFITYFETKLWLSYVLAVEINNQSEKDLLIRISII